MDDPSTLNHSKWEFKYHVVFIPKYRRKKLFVEIRAELGKIFRELARPKCLRLKKGNVKGGSCAYDDLDSAEIRSISISGDRTSERKKCNSNSKNLYRSKEEFCGSAFLGPLDILFPRLVGTKK